MGRILVFLLLAVMIMPAVLLARLWRYAGQRRQVNEGTLGLVVPTVEAERTLARWPVRARWLRLAGLLAGLGLVVLLIVMVGERSVFVWPLAIGFGYLLGVLVGEAARPRPLWPATPDATRSAARIADYIHPGLVWSLRGTVVIVVAAVVTAGLVGDIDADGAVTFPVSCPAGGTQALGPVASGAAGFALLALVGVAWLLAETALFRALRRPRAGEADDVPVDDALRSASAHAAVGAASVLVLLPLGAAALVLGFQVVDSCLNSDPLSIALIGGGLSAVIAGLLVIAFLPGWLRQVRRRAAVRS
ncbi:hypothetical protein BH20ACT5_BH20ACT5_21760 [soil metagenome]